MLSSHALSEGFVHSQCELHPSPDLNILRFSENPYAKVRARIVQYVRDLDPIGVEAALSAIATSYQSRHRDLHRTLQCHAEQLRQILPEVEALDSQRQLVAATYFTMEYAVAAAALFNPSIVPHPDQSRSDNPEHLRVLLSLRAVGEGHISTILYREGVVDGDGQVELDPSPPWLSPYQLSNPIRRGEDHYVVDVPDGVPLAERALFPLQEAECNGMEDLRMVRFEQDGQVIYFGTYTAYDGRSIFPGLIETTDFKEIHVHRPRGEYSRNKGMAMFPRKLGGRYAMMSRHDGQRSFIMRSDSPYEWNECEPIDQPMQPWELCKTGNCGSPVEIDEGWLLLTHGVGPMREYCIGALLLDKVNPAKVLAYTPQPLLRPPRDRRNGYVPNVVYTCGMLLHRGRLVIPYGAADTCILFASIEVNHLLESMRSRR